MSLKELYALVVKPLIRLVRAILFHPVVEPHIVLHVPVELHLSLKQGLKNGRVRDRFHAGQNVVPVVQELGQVVVYHLITCFLIAINFRDEPSRAYLSH